MFKTVYMHYLVLALKQLIKLRAELEAVMKEVQNLMDTKLGLELEISAYRKLLESEENRYSTISVKWEKIINCREQLGGGGQLERTN